MEPLLTNHMTISPIITFGLMLIIGTIGGYVAHRLSWLPSITGFMIVGFIFGPGGIGLLNEETIVSAKILIDISLALILYRLGLSLDIKSIRHSPQLLFTSLAESAATFILVAYSLFLFDIPILMAALVASIAISSSPAVLLHVAHEVGAKGVVTESTTTLVALNNLISVTMFSILLPAAHYSVGSDWSTIILQPLYGFFGSLAVGFLLAYSLHYVAVKTRQASQYKLALVIGTIMIALGLANEFSLSMVFISLIIGVVIKSLEWESVVSDLEFGPPFELFFIVLFVFAGVSLHVHELIEFAPVIFSLVILRTIAKVLGVTAMSSLQSKPVTQGVTSGLLLIPMAGMAIGLTITSGNTFPQYAATVSAIVLGAVTIFEAIGPPIANFAFNLSGEAGAQQESTDSKGARDKP